MLAFLQRVHKRGVGLVHEKSVQLFLLAIHNRLLNDELTLLYELDVPLGDDKEAIGHEGKHSVLIQKVLFMPWELLCWQKLGFSDVALRYFVLLKKRTDDVGREDQKDCKLEAVIIDTADYKQRKREGVIVLALVN